MHSLKRFDTTRAHGRDITSRLDRLTPEVSLFLSACAKRCTS